MKDILGMVFGRLTVLADAGTDAKRRRRWFCVCTCGNFRVVTGHDLRAGDTKSCGCLASEIRQQTGYQNKGKHKHKKESAFLAVLAKYRVQAKNKGRKFSLTVEAFRTLVEGSCYYCEDVRSNSKKYYDVAYDYTGIDRISSAKGYTVENTRSCCIVCNRMKLAMGEQAFYQHIDRIHKRQVQLGNIPQKHLVPVDVLGYETKFSYHDS